MRVTSYVLAGVGVGSLLYLALKPNTSTLKSYYQSMKNKLMTQDGRGFPVNKAGHPDPRDLEDNNMVSEGAQYGVNYYNHVEQ